MAPDPKDERDEAHLAMLVNLNMQPHHHRIRACSPPATTSIW
jgi:hypothetical protein